MGSNFDLTGWGNISGQLRMMYPELNDADLYWGRSSKDDLIAMISAKLGKTKKQLMDTIDALDYPHRE